MAFLESVNFFGFIWYLTMCIVSTPHCIICAQLDSLGLIDWNGIDSNLFLFLTISSWTKLIKLIVLLFYLKYYMDRVKLRLRYSRIKIYLHALFTICRLMMENLNFYIYFVKIVLDKISWKKNQKAPSTNK